MLGKRRVFVVPRSINICNVYLDVGVGSAAHVEGGELRALDGRHVQGLRVEVVFELEKKDKFREREINTRNGHF